MEGRRTPLSALLSHAALVISGATVLRAGLDRRCACGACALHAATPHGAALNSVPASADEFADLEARLLAKQQVQFDALQKRLLLGNAAAPTGTVEEVDQPFAEYARNFYVTASLMVCLVASIVYLAASGYIAM